MMMRALLLFVMTVAVTQAKAEVLGSIGTTVNYQLSSNGRTYDAVAPFAVRAGYRFRFADVFGEYSYVKSSTGSDLVSIGTSNQEFLLFIKKGDPTARVFKPFVAVGAGGHYQTVSTRFQQQTMRDPGQLEGVLAAIGGVDLRLMKQLSFTVEGRATLAESYSPSPLFGIGVFLNLAL